MCVVCLNTFLIDFNPFTNKSCTLEQDNANYGAIGLFFGSDPTSRRLRHLASVPEGNLNSVQEITRIRSNEGELQQQGTRSLFNFGENPRTTILFDKCEFRNNSLIVDEDSKLFGYNGVFSVISRQADVTMTNCIFKDNRYELRRDGPVCCTVAHLFENHDSLFRLTVTRFVAGVWVSRVRRSWLYSQHSEFLLH
jgi:hypothetical protein